MQAQIANQNGISVVYLSGRVDVETAEPFRAACLRQFKGCQVVFDFASLSFVGSQGILPFLETLQAFYETAPGNFKLSRVGIEFRKLFAATPLNVVEICDSVEQAIHSFLNSTPNMEFSAAIAPVPLTDDCISYRSEPVVDKKSSGSFDSDDELET